MGDFTTAGEVESVTAHEVINTNVKDRRFFKVVKGQYPYAAAL